jgi:hypothetical protein
MANRASITPPLAAFAVLAQLAIGISVGAQAQTTDERGVTGPPVGIIPQGPTGNDGQAGAPGSDFFKPVGESEQYQSIQSRPGRPDETIQVGTLDAVDVSGVGVLGAGDQGFPAALWSGSDRSSVVALLRQMPVATRSAKMNDLARRLLLSQAAPPAGTSIGNSLIEVRVARLFETGDFEAVVALTDRLPNTVIDDGIMKARADALLLQGDMPAACEVAANMRLVGQSEHWQKMGAFCQYTAGNTSMAELSANMLRDRGTVDAVFFGLLDNLLGHASKPPINIRLNEALTAVMFQAAKGDTATAFASVKDAPPSIARWLALSSIGGPDQRIDVGEQAARHGAVPVRALQRLYALYPFGAMTVQDALNDTTERSFGVRQALYYQAAAVAEDQNRTIELLSAAWGLTDQYGGHGIVTRLNEQAVRSIEPQSDFVWAARSFLRASLALGDADLAYEWHSLVDPRTTRARTASYNSIRLLELDLRIARPSERLPWDKDEANELLSIAASQGERALRQTRAKLQLMRALGFDIQETAIQGPDNQLSAPDGSLQQQALSALAEASSQGRLGETVALAIIAIGPNGAEGRDARVVAAAVAALNRVGLSEDARTLALEASLAVPRTDQSALAVQ